MNSIYISKPVHIYVSIFMTEMYFVKYCQSIGWFTLNKIIQNDYVID